MPREIGLKRAMGMLLTGRRVAAQEGFDAGFVTEVHWGLFKPAHHSWTEPVERVLAAAKCRNVDVLVPRPGESIEPALSSSRVRWWPEIPWLSAHETPHRCDARRSRLAAL